jgi:UDP-glucose 4-epimerase
MVPASCRYPWHSVPDRHAPRPQLAEAELGWRATRTLRDMCADHWRWTAANPAGFLTKETVAVAPAGPEAAAPAGPMEE